MMKRYSKLRKAMVGLVGGLTISAVAQAGVVVINDEMPRRAPGSTSGSGDTVEANCPPDPSGNDWQGATAELMVRQVGSDSTVDINVKNAVPNTVFTVWLRIKGGAGFNDGGSPLTGGGATPLVPGSALDNVFEYSPFGSMPAGTPNPTNGFTTNKNGNANFSIDLDFPVVRGAYPFHLLSATLLDPNPAPNVPTAISNPAEGTGGPFLMRVISHCTDQLGHGLSPGVREAWFQYP